MKLSDKPQLISTNCSNKVVITMQIVLNRVLTAVVLLAAAVRDIYNGLSYVIIATFDLTIEVYKLICSYTQSVLHVLIELQREWQGVTVETLLCSGVLQQKKALKYDVDEKDLDNLFFIWVTAGDCSALTHNNTHDTQYLNNMGNSRCLGY